MGPLFDLLDLAIRIYIFIIVAYVILRMLVQFDIVNPRVLIVIKADRLLQQLSEPSLRPIRRFLPPIAGFDLAPLIVVLILLLVRQLLAGGF